jgi:hypothetical protein
MTLSSESAPQALAADRRELLRRVLLERMGRERTVPASFAQERLWFLERVGGTGAAYNVPAALRLAGALEVGALEGALGELVRRHEALRTTLREREGRPEQVIAPFIGFSLRVEEVAPGEVAARAAALAAEPFDLAAGPLFRAALLRAGPAGHLLLLCIHHAVVDGWSMELLLRELAVVYGAFHDGRPSPLAELPAQYADHAVWERDPSTAARMGSVESRKKLSVRLAWLA